MQKEIKTLYLVYKGKGGIFIMTKKRIASCLLLAGICPSIFTGCGNTDQTLYSNGAEKDGS